MPVKDEKDKNNDEKICPFMNGRLCVEEKCALWRSSNLTCSLWKGY